MEKHKYEVKTISYQKVYDIVSERLHKLFDTIKNQGDEFVNSISKKDKSDNHDNKLMRDSVKYCHHIGK